VALSGWRKLLALTLPAIVIAMLVAAAAIEVWVRATWDPKNGRPGFFLSDPVRGQRLAAGYDGWFAGVPVRINSLELRDRREYDLAKGPRTFRILVLGDSVTFGHGSVYSYPELLERRLVAWRSDIDWQVWNAAVPGYNTSQELAHLLEVGDRFRPDLVIVGFYENDLVDNQPLQRPGRVRAAAVHTLSFARKHLYSLELYKKVYLTAAWRFSRANAYRLRLQHLGSEEQLLSRTADVSELPEQRLTAFERLTAEQVAAVDCVYGMTPNPALIPAIQRDAGFPAWIEAVRGFQRLNREGRYRIMFFANDAPPTCPDGDVFYDGGSKAIDELYQRVLGDGTPVVSSYDAFLRTRPSQMPAASAHSVGNANAVKADVLFDYLQRHVLPPLLPSPEPARRRSPAPSQ
jgi:GDSL-like Lipase/Acylhydrolase family